MHDLALPQVNAEDAGDEAISKAKCNNMGVICVDRVLGFNEIRSCVLCTCVALDNVVQMSHLKTKVNCMLHCQSPNPCMLA